MTDRAIEKFINETCYEIKKLEQTGRYDFSIRRRKGWNEGRIKKSLCKTL